MSASDLLTSIWIRHLNAAAAANQSLPPNRNHPEQPLNEASSTSGHEQVASVLGNVEVPTSDSRHELDQREAPTSAAENTQPEDANPGEGYTEDSHSTSGPPCIEDQACARLMARLGPRSDPPSRAFPILPGNPFNIDLVRPSRSPYSAFTNASTYYSVSHERPSSVYVRNDQPVPDQPYEIWCACASCRDHRLVIRQLDQGRVLTGMHGFRGPPLLAPVCQVSTICRCQVCAYHLLLIDQLAEKIAIGATIEIEHWTDVSFEELVVSDWQDVLGKTEQAYWRYKLLGELAIRDRSRPINLGIILRAAECLEAVAFLPFCLTRQVYGEPLSFDEILREVFLKVALNIHDQIYQTVQTNATPTSWHKLLLMVDTFEIHAHTFPVATRIDNIRLIRALSTTLRAVVPPACLRDHSFHGIKFDESNTRYTTTRPVILPPSIPLNHARRAASVRNFETFNLPSGSLIVPSI